MNPTTSTLKTTTTLKYVKTTTTLKVTTTTQKPFFITTSTFPRAVDFTSTTLGKVQHKSLISFSNIPRNPFKDRDIVTFSLEASDADGISMMQLFVGGKLVKTCYPNKAVVASCVGGGGPYSVKETVEVHVTDAQGFVEVLVGSLDVQTTDGDICSGDCVCMTTAQAQAVFGSNYAQCSPVLCGTESTGGGGTVFDGGSTSTPKYCYHMGSPPATCPSGCSCLSPMEASASIGGLSYRPCGCSVQNCASGKTCYELGCRPISGQLTYFKPEQAPDVFVLAVHQISGDERIMPSGIPLNISDVDIPLSYAGCLSDGPWDITPMYVGTRDCENCPQVGEWLPPASFADASDQCGPQMERNFHYNRPEYTPPIVSMQVEPQRLNYLSNPFVEVNASDSSGIHKIDIYQGGIDSSCESVESTLVKTCCFSGEYDVTCLLENITVGNLSQVTYTAKVCDMAGNINTSQITLDVAVNETNLKIGSVCSCREGKSIPLAFSQFDDIEIGVFTPSHQPALAFSSADDGRILIIQVSDGMVIYNYTTIYSQYDRLITCDTNSNGLDEIVIANVEDGQVYVYEADGTYLTKFDIGFEMGDAFDCGGIYDENISSIVKVSHSDESVEVYDFTGALSATYTLNEDFTGEMYFGDMDYHDGFAIADFFGDSKEEIAIAYNSENHVLIYDNTFTPKIRVPLERYTPFDSFKAADVLSDEKSEILLGVDDDGAVYVYDLSGLLKINYFPYTKYDGLTAGNLFGDGKDGFAVAIDEDQKVYFEYGQDAPPEVFT